MSGRRLERAKKRLEVATDPVGHRAFAVDGPSEHGTTIDVLDETSELGGIALAEFAGRNRFIENLARFIPDSAELRESDGVKVRVGQIDLQIGQAVGHGFRCWRERSAFRVKLDQSFEVGRVLCARRGKLLRHRGRSGSAQGQEQPALGAKALNESGGNDAGFFGDVGKGQFRRAEALHDARGGGQNLFVGGFARARGHFQRSLCQAISQQGATARITEWLFIFHLTLLNGRLLFGVSSFPEVPP